MNGSGSCASGIAEYSASEATSAPSQASTEKRVKRHPRPARMRTPPSVQVPSSSRNRVPPKLSVK